jgi:hypothetical protein
MKTMRTEINDIPETSVELSELEMRVVSGGLASLLACYSASALAGSTNVHTGQDWDSDSTPLPVTFA